MQYVEKILRFFPIAYDSLKNELSLGEHCFAYRLSLST